MRDADRMRRRPSAGTRVVWALRRRGRAATAVVVVERRRGAAKARAAQDTPRWDLRTTAVAPVRSGLPLGMSFAPWPPTSGTTPGVSLDVLPGWRVEDEYLFEDIFGGRSIASAAARRLLDQAGWRETSTPGFDLPPRQTFEAARGQATGRPSPFTFALRDDIRWSDGSTHDPRDLPFIVDLDRSGRGAAMQLGLPPDLADPGAPFTDPDRFGLFFDGVDVTGGTVPPGSTCGLLIPPAGSGLNTGWGCKLGSVSRLRPGGHTSFHVDLDGVPPAGREAALFPSVPGINGTAGFLMLVPQHILDTLPPGGVPTPTPTPAAPAAPSLAPLIVLPGATVYPEDSVEIDGQVMEGSSPYTATIDWGDGTRADTVLPAAAGGGPTPFAFQHPFAATGDFPIHVDVVDGLGRRADAATTVHVIQRACATPPGATLLAPGGDYNLFIAGECAGMLPAGLASVRVTFSSGKIDAWDVHSPAACENPTPGAPTAVLKCRIKPDGRICWKLDVQPPPAAGDQPAKVELLDGSGMVLDGGVFFPIFGAIGPPACNTGDSP